jgi:hypothetical protein
MNSVKQNAIAAFRGKRVGFNYRFAPILAGRSADIRRNSEADGQPSTLSECKACI